MPDVRVSLDVFLELRPLLEGLPALVADVLPQPRLVLALVHPHLVLKIQLKL